MTVENLWLGLCLVCLLKRQDLIKEEGWVVEVKLSDSTSPLNYIYISTVITDDAIGRSRI